MKPIETPSRIEPCWLDPIPGPVNDLVAELVAAATALESRLHPMTAETLAELVRIMNCYYSNLIEGHNTRPREIESALVDLEDDSSPERRDLLLEA